jgi:hypothetical protein
LGKETGVSTAFDNGAINKINRVDQVSENVFKSKIGTTIF